jgi:Na+/H+ antiporter 1
MMDSQLAKTSDTRLPSEFVDWLRKPIARFLRIEAAGGAVLLLFTVAALVLSNSAWAHQFLNIWETPVGFQIGTWEFTRSARDWINDGMMTLFFFLVALELKRELVLGELNRPRTAALSIAAALGGMLVPAALYLALQWGQPGETGWGTVMATDTAFVIGCLALMGSRVPHSFAGNSGRHRRRSCRRDWLQQPLKLGRACPGCYWSRDRSRTCDCRSPNHTDLFFNRRIHLARGGCVRNSRNYYWRDTRDTDAGPPMG